LQQFKREIDVLDEQLTDLEHTWTQMAERSDENGRFIYGTTVEMIRMLKVKYCEELERRKETEEKGKDEVSR